MLGLILPVAGALLLLLANKKKATPPVKTVATVKKPMVKAPVKIKTPVKNPAIENPAQTVPYRAPVPGRPDNIGDALNGVFINNGSTNVLGGILSDTLNGIKTTTIKR